MNIKTIQSIKIKLPTRDEWMALLGVACLYGAGVASWYARLDVYGVKMTLFPALVDLRWTLLLVSVSAPLIWRRLIYASFPIQAVVGLASVVILFQSNHVFFDIFVAGNLMPVTIGCLVGGLFFFAQMTISGMTALMCGWLIWRKK